MRGKDKLINIAHTRPISSENVIRVPTVYGHQVEKEIFRIAFTTNSKTYLPPSLISHPLNL